MKRFNFVISADNNPALKSMRAVSAELYRINAAFRQTRSKAGSGAAAGGGALDPKALNVVQKELREVNSIFKAMTGSQNQWERNAGFTQLKNAFKGTADAASDLKGAVNGILGPVLALTGIGSVAGIAGIAADFGDLAKQVKLTNYETSLSQKTIQGWMNTGQAFGIKTEDMTAGLKNFSKNMEDVSFGRNNEMLAFFSRPDIGIKDIRTRVQTPEGVDSMMREVAMKLQQFSPIARSQMLDRAQLGFMKPMLMYGPDEYGKRQKMVGKLGYVASDDQLEKVRDYNRALDGLNLALSTFQKKLTDNIIPMFQPIVQGFSNWIVKTDNVKLVFDLLAEAIGVTMVAAIGFLGKAMLATPFGRIIALAEILITGGTILYEKWKPFRDLIQEIWKMMKELATLPWRIHLGNFGSNKSMLESYDDYSKRTSIPSPVASNDNPMIVTSQGITFPKTPSSAAYDTSLSGGSAGDMSQDDVQSALMGTPAMKGQNARSTVEINLNGAPAGTTVVTKPAPGVRMPVNINYGLQPVP